MRKLALLTVVAALAFAAPAQADTAAVTPNTVRALIHIDGPYAGARILPQIRFLLYEAPLLGEKSEAEVVALAQRVNPGNLLAVDLARATWRLLHC